MENRIYLFTNEKNKQMMSFVVTTKDQKVIVIDGGWDEDAAPLLSHLQEITSSEIPHIDAWFLTHAHEDHIDALSVFYESYIGRFTCDAVYYTFPSVPYFERYEKGSVHTLSRFYHTLPSLGSAAHIVSTGDVYNIGDASVEILLTYDDTVTYDIVNNSSTVFRMTLGGKTVLFMGDAGEIAGKRLLARYQTDLKSDLCQLAHHGQDAVTEDVYDAIAPTACLWCTPDWLWVNNNYLSNDPETVGQGPFTTLETRAWMEKLGVKEHYIAKDGDCVITL